MKNKSWSTLIALTLCAQVATAQTPEKAQENQRPRQEVPVLSEQQIGEIQDPTGLKRLMVVYQRTGDFQRLAWVLERLVVLFPNHGDYKFALAVSYAQLADKSKTYDLLLRMKAQGFGYDLSGDKRFEKVSDTRVWEYVVENLKSNLAQFGEGKVAFELPQGDTLFETIGWDPKRKQFLVGSAREGKVYRADAKGKLSDFISADADNGMWSVYALAVDAERDLLYVASSASVFFKNFKQDDFGKAGVFKFRLSTGKLIERYLLQEGGVHTLSSITVGKGGQMFVADGVRNAIYRIEGGELKLVATDPNLTSIRGLAVSDDGKLLFFADYTLGIFGVHLASGTGFALKYDPEALVLGGIDGLYWYDGTLVTIASGMAPKRVVRLSLSPDGTSISRIMPLDVANPAFALPTYGTIADDNLYFIANSQKKAYGQYGEPKNLFELRAVKVFRSDLRFAWNEAGVATSGVPVRQASFEEGMKLMQTPPTLLDPPKPAPVEKTGKDD